MKTNLTEETSAMSKTIPSTVTIHFTDGTTQRFAFEAPEIEPAVIADRMEKFLARNQIVVQLPNRLLIIPIQSIKSMEVALDPAYPLRPFKFAISNARPIESSGSELEYSHGLHK
jgi:hypothetical protein